MYIPYYRLKSNGAPVLSTEEIEVIAERFIQDFNPEALKDPMELDIDSFAFNYLHLKQDFQYLSHNGMYLGMAVFNDTNKIPVYMPGTKEADYISAEARTVIIDNRLLEDDQEGRYRYTVGHEAGHDIFHKAYFAYNPNQLSLLDDEKEPMIQCRISIPREQRKPVEDWNDKDRMEWQANHFAAAFLMPRKMIFKLIRSLPKQKSWIDPASYVHAVVTTFNVSWQAAENRLSSLGIINNLPSRDGSKILYLDFWT